MGDDTNPNSVIEEIMESPEKLRDLDLDAFAEELERQVCIVCCACVCVCVSVYLCVCVHVCMYFYKCGVLHWKVLQLYNILQYVVAKCNNS